MKKSISIWVMSLILGAFIAGAGLGWFVLGKQNKPVYYVQTQQLFESFELAKEYKVKLDNAQDARKRLLEKLELDVQQLASRYQAGQASLADTDSLQRLSILLESKKEEYTIDSEKEASNYNDQIWSQLNQYLKEYCLQTGCAYVLGADGSGSIMAADDSFDHTEEVIAFVNQRYKGGI